MLKIKIDRVEEDRSNIKTVDRKIHSLRETITPNYKQSIKPEEKRRKIIGIFQTLRIQQNYKEKNQRRAKEI